jgi:hypothetical protein
MSIIISNRTVLLLCCLISPILGPLPVHSHRVRLTSQARRCYWPPLLREVQYYPSYRPLSGNLRAVRHEARKNGLVRGSVGTGKGLHPPTSPASRPVDGQDGGGRDAVPWAIEVDLGRCS